MTSVASSGGEHRAAAPKPSAAAGKAAAPAPSLRRQCRHGVRMDAALESDQNMQADAWEDTCVAAEADQNP